MDNPREYEIKPIETSSQYQEPISPGFLSEVSDTLTILIVDDVLNEAWCKTLMAFRIADSHRQESSSTACTRSASTIRGRARQAGTWQWIALGHCQVPERMVDVIYVLRELLGWGGNRSAAELKRVASPRLASQAVRPQRPRG